MSDPANVQRGRLNRMRGLQFERAVIRRLRREGFTVSRVLEHDGFTHGVDILVHNTPWGLVPIQCKRSNNGRAGFVGLQEVRLNSPVARYPLVACFFNYHAGSATQGKWQILVNRVPSPLNGFELLSLGDFLVLLRDTARALSAGAKVPTLSSDGPLPLK